MRRDSVERRGEKRRERGAEEQRNSVEVKKESCCLVGLTGVGRHSCSGCHTELVTPSMQSTYAVYVLWVAFFRVAPRYDEICQTCVGHPPSFTDL